jgi:hypothetical protein
MIQYLYLNYKKNKSGYVFAIIFRNKDDRIKVQ